MTVSETKLLPCPFCGGQAEHQPWTTRFNTIYCDDCAARVKTVGSKDDAICYWNARIPAVESVVTDEMVNAAVEAAWPGPEIVYDDHHVSAESMMRAALEAALAAQANGPEKLLDGGIDGPYNEIDPTRAKRKLAYVKRWRTIVSLPEQYAVEIVEALRIPVGGANETALTAALSDQAGGWQDISTAPKDGTAIVLGFWYQGRFAQYMGYGDPAGWRESSRAFYPLHMQGWFSLWHRLPAAPPPSSTAGEVG